MSEPWNNGQPENSIPRPHTLYGGGYNQQAAASPVFQSCLLHLNTVSNHQGPIEQLSSAPSPSHEYQGERGGSVVECRTPEREVRGSKPTAAVLCPWARHFTPRKYWLITQEAMAPSRHDWKIVDWDVKPQHNQPAHEYHPGGGADNGLVCSFSELGFSSLQVFFLRKTESDLLAVFVILGHWASKRGC